MLTFFVILLSLYDICIGVTQYCQNHGSFMDDDVRTKVLHFHNGLRYALVQGTSPGYEGKDLPPAKSLYKMRWSCALEEKALKLTKNCSHSVSESLDNGQNVHYTNDGEYISKEGKNAVIHDAMYRWTLPAQYYFMKDTRYESDRLYTFANMAHHEIYELGCNYEQCGDSFGGVGEAVFACVYNKKSS
ncbi:SCP-like protein [Ostertagia ostertagi]